ncbi:hypothetical protein Nepgr_003174 [Nepenthes gracilis]|uniref:Uncharacterized protein n=1 Tax=Nepenthes gracilis TaxID=150966 RepID=A0AAD3XDE7_NEPGR|nr:hypothetical protein Nepgr_003174 [Nepenthes gracilis]
MIRFTWIFPPGDMAGELLCLGAREEAAEFESSPGRKWRSRNLWWSRVWDHTGIRYSPSSLDMAGVSSSARAREGEAAGWKAVQEEVGRGICAFGLVSSDHSGIPYSPSSLVSL